MKMAYKIEKVRRVASWVVDRTTDESNFPSDQFDYQNNFLLQEFVMEQLSPVCRFSLKRDFFNMDHSPPGRLNFLKWFLSWCFLFSSVGFMSAWIIVWSVTNGSKAVDAWGMTIFVVLICDMFMNEVMQIYFINVIVVEKLRPQLYQIYSVLQHVMRTRLEQFTPSQDIRIVQHISAACRAARSTQLNTLIASNILNALDDADIAICRLKRLNRVFDIGIIAYSTLYLPSYLTDCYEIVQQTSLDLILPIFWSCFLLLSFILNSVHPALLGMFYFFLLLVFISVVFIFPSEQFKRFVSTEESNEELEEEENVESLRNQNVVSLESEKLSKETLIQSDLVWRGMNNVTPGASELTGFQIDLVEFDEEFAEQSIDGLFDHFGKIEKSRKSSSSFRRFSVNDDVMDSTTALRESIQPQESSQQKTNHHLMSLPSEHKTSVLGSDPESRATSQTREIVREVKRNSIYLKNQELTTKDESDEQI